MTEPTFAEIFEEAYRLAGEHGVPMVALAIAHSKPPPPKYEATYDAILQTAYKNLCKEAKEKEWNILQLTTP